MKLTEKQKEAFKFIYPKFVHVDFPSQEYRFYPGINFAWELAEDPNKPDAHFSLHIAKLTLDKLTQLGLLIKGNNERLNVYSLNEDSEATLGLASDLGLV